MKTSQVAPIHSEQVLVRLTPHESALLDDLAAKLGCGRAEAMRRALTLTVVVDAAEALH